MATVSAFDAKTRFGELLDRVAKGEEVVITRHDKPIARIVPEGAARLEDVRRAVEGLRQSQHRILARTKGRGKLSDREVRSAIEEGRL
jgi:prevent-host-death family protein